jgi:HEAT repeat protein
VTGKYQLIRSLEDYQRFLRHPDPMIRDWAAERIETQYPDQAAENLANLVNDPDPYLQITAVKAVGESSDPRYEPALLAAYPETEGYVRNWFMTTLGKLGSRTLLPQLVAELEAAPSQAPSEEHELLALRSLAEAVGHYPDQAARLALWHFVESYDDDDWATYAAFAGLLNFPEPDTIPRLVRRYGQLKPRAEGAWLHAVVALADAVGLGRLAQETARKLPEGPYPALWQVDDWLDREIFYSETFEDAWEEAAERSYAGILPHVLAELERAMAEREDDLAAWLEVWRGGQRPTGYQWRMLVAHQVIAALAEWAPLGEREYQASVALALALLGQALTDENDEALLQAASDQAGRRAVLLQILSSPRQNVMPDVVDQVATLGLDVIPDLIEVLEGDDFWPQPRALQALTRIARTHPGAVEPAITPILDLIDEYQSDYILESAQEALVAIGPPVIDLAVARLGQDYVYDIYVGSALAEIPTQASAESLMKYVESRGVLEEGEAEELATLAHASAIPFLQDYYTPGDSLLATVLHKLAVVTDYVGPERIEWWATAVNDYAAFIRASSGREPTWLTAPDPALSARDRKPDAGEEKGKKGEPLQTKAKRKRRRTKKKKRRR